MATPALSKSQLGSAWSSLATMFVIGSGLLSLLGWALALTQQLKPIPYLLGLVVVGIIVAGVHRRLHFQCRPLSSEFQRLKHRLRRPIFVVYAIIWLAAVVGGALYAPSNYDALAYRIPQLLHWISDGGWHWIDAPNSRMNIAPPGMNWLIAPLYFLTKSDRLWYLVNAAAFSFFPGFLFEMFRRSGASSRTAWWFMWLVPCAYTFALQAGSIGNDLLGTTYAIAGIAIAMRARDNGRAADVCLSGIAIAMATGVKSLNLPLLIPWVVAVWPAINHLFRRRLVAVVAILIGTFSSCLPTTILNVSQTGHWTGDPQDEHRVRQPGLGAAVASNAVMLATSNTQPPVLPNPTAWNERFETMLGQSSLAAFCRLAPRFEIRWGELPTEELAGVGPGLLVVSGLLLITGFRLRSALWARRRRTGNWVALSSWLALLLFLSRFSSEAIGRLSAGFFPILLLLIMLIAKDESLFRRRWVCILAVLCACLSLPALVLSPARPLFPVQTLLSYAGPSRLGRVGTVFQTYAQRPDCYAPLLSKLGQQESAELWFAGGGDDPEAPAWKPYGTRKVRQWTALSSRPQVALASEFGIRQRFGLPWEDFLATTGAKIREEEELNIRAGRGTERWYLLHFP